MTRGQKRAVLELIDAAEAVIYMGQPGKQAGMIIGFRVDPMKLATIPTIGVFNDMVELAEKSARRNT